MSLDFSMTWHADTGGGVHPVCACDLNITHNVARMWRRAGIEEALYESHGMKARDVVDILRAGYADMATHFEEYEDFNPPNGWGSYEGALAFLRDIIRACRDFPDAVISISA